METQGFQSDEAHADYLAKFQINPTRAMFTIILSILVDVFGYSMVFPLLPNFPYTLYPFVSLYLCLFVPYFITKITIIFQLTKLKLRT